MSDDVLDDDLDDDTPDEGESETVTLSREAVRSMRAAAKGNKRLQRELAEAQQARRDLAFLKAGVDTESPIGKLFARSYEGDLSTDAIKAGAEGIPGLLPEAPPVKDGPVIGDDERRQTELRRALADDAPADDGLVNPPEKPARQLAQEVFDGAMKLGKPREDAMGLSFRALLGPAANGDASVLWDPQGAER